MGCHLTKSTALALDPATPRNPQGPEVSPCTLVARGPPDLESTDSFGKEAALAQKWSPGSATSVLPILAPEHPAVIATSKRGTPPASFIADLSTETIHLDSTSSRSISRISKLERIGKLQRWAASIIVLDPRVSLVNCMRSRSRSPVLCVVVASLTAVHCCRRL